jgi:hypothetical protein
MLKFGIIDAGECAITRLAGHQNTDRNRLKRYEPLWPIPLLTPASPCPHGIRIRIGRVCGVCHAATRATQQEIEKMPAPPPINPEDQALSQIAFFRDWLKDHPEATTRTKTHVVRQISRLEAVVREWIPTKYQPRANLKGGRS